MHPVDCPEWEYEDHRESASILKEETKSVLLDLRTGKIATKEFAANTRPIHYRLFRKLTPDECPYYAGHYRGEQFRCLKYLRVGIKDDPRVGAPPEQVQGRMAILKQLIDKTIPALDQGMQVPDRHLKRQDKILYVVIFACQVFEFFLRIHPYVNGNGHAARFCIWALLGRYKLWPTRWSIEPKPPDPPYTELIVQYRDGNKIPLEKYILHCLYMEN